MSRNDPAPEFTPSEADQAEIVAFLQDPATHGGAAVERVDTHISRIFLAGDFAWKLKRAIATNYLDFSTLGERERLCRHELDLNRRTADFYLDVVPVTRGPNGLRIGGDGAPVEWLLKMARFDRQNELDRLADAGKLTVPLMERLADAVAAMHARAPVTPGFGDASDVRARIDQIAGALDDAGGPSPDAKGWRDAAHAACDTHAQLLDHRAATGLVRRCHGDLHLGNIVAIEGQPLPFDAIEFNEAIASIDIAYDIALTLFDLLARDKAILANALLNRWLGATRDYRGLAPMPLYISMRAAVRAMVAAARGQDEVAARDLDLARRALAAQPQPRLIAIGGVSGSGKSTIARILAPGLAPLTGAVVIRSDVVRKRLAGARPEDPLPQTAYDDRVSRRVMARMAIAARHALRANAAVILDATFLGPMAQECARTLAHSEGIALTGLWLDLTGAEAAARIAARPRDASDATVAVLRRQLPRAMCPPGWHSIDATGPADTVARRAREALTPST